MVLGLALFQEPAEKLAGTEGEYTAVVLDWPEEMDYGVRLLVGLQTEDREFKTRLYLYDGEAFGGWYTSLYGNGTAIEEGQPYACASLQLYDITLSQRFLPDSTSTSPSPSLAQGESVQGTIVVQKPDYVVLALNTPAKSLVLGSMTSFNNAKQPFSGLNLGDEVDCTLLCAPGVGGAVCDLRNAFKDTLSAADSEAIRSFFAEVSVGDLSSKSTFSGYGSFSSSSSTMSCNLTAAFVHISLTYSFSFPLSFSSRYFSF